MLTTLPSAYQQLHADLENICDDNIHHCDHQVAIRRHVISDHSDENHRLHIPL